MSRYPSHQAEHGHQREDQEPIGRIQSHVSPEQKTRAGNVTGSRRGIWFLRKDKAVPGNQSRGGACRARGRGPSRQAAATGPEPRLRDRSKGCCTDMAPTRPNVENMDEGDEIHKAPWLWTARPSRADRAGGKKHAPKGQWGPSAHRDSPPEPGQEGGAGPRAGRCALESPPPLWGGPQMSMLRTQGSGQAQYSGRKGL